MSVSGSEYIRHIKAQIEEVDPSEVRELRGRGRGPRRRPRERASGTAGTSPAPSTSRAATSSRASRARSPTARQHVILYCASGKRSALAAHTLEHELGYENVESMTGGITLWKDRGYEVEVPQDASRAEQRERYSRHFLLPEVGVEGQQKLLDAKVLLLGAGGLGSPTALYLAAAGVGTLGIVDDDVVDLSNLQRQVIHTTDRIGVPKVDSAEETIKALNPDVERRQVPDAPRRLEHHGDHRGLRRHRRRRRQLPDALPAQRRDGAPAASRSCRAAILGFDGQLSVFEPYEGPCYRCLFRQPPPAELAPSCGANGVLGVLPGHDGPAAGDRGRQADHRRRRAARSAACCCTTRSARRSPSSRSAATPSARSARASPTRSPTRRWASSRTTRRSAPRPVRLRDRSWPRSRSRPSCARPSAASARSRPTATNVGEVLRALADAHPETAGPALRRRRRAQPLRQRLPQRRGRPRARRARHAGRGERHARDPAGDGRRLTLTLRAAPAGRARRRPPAPSC